MKARIGEIENAVGGYAVMRHSNSRKMQCAMIHDDYTSALDESRRLFAESVERNGIDGACRFYVLRIVDRVGIFGRVLEQGGKSL